MGHGTPANLAENGIEIPAEIAYDTGPETSDSAGSNPNPDQHDMDTPTATPASATIQKRNLALYIILLFVTCGLFGIYWMYTMNEDTNKVSGHPEAMNGVLVILLTLVTCGLFAFFWLYNMGNRIDETKIKRGQPAGNTGVLYLVLAIFGLGFVSEILLQSELNKLAE